MTTPLVAPTPADVPALARLWHDTWHEAHAAHVPAALLAERSLESFATRLDAMLDRVVMASDGAGPLGFCAIDPAGRGEIDHLFVAPRGRGSGLAGRLLADGEARLVAANCPRPLLNVLAQNVRARRFYRRHGWQEHGIVATDLTTRSGTVRLPSLVMVKVLA